MEHELTPVSKFGISYAKREDKAAFSGPDDPSGSKVRQFLAMAAAMPGKPMLVGCSAHSCMQVYIASAAKKAGVKAIVYTAQRKHLTESTQYAVDMGAELNFVKPAYLSVIRLRARARAKELGGVVAWNPALAMHDTMWQCQNLPARISRVVVPTGSGLTASGVLAGLAEYGPHGVPVLAVAVSTMADEDQILENARKLTSKKLPKLMLVRWNGQYEQWCAARLPDGTVLDPYYAAKAYQFVVKGDCLWVSGVRPEIAMPFECREELAG